MTYRSATLLLCLLLLAPACTSGERILPRAAVVQGKADHLDCVKLKAQLAYQNSLIKQSDGLEEQASRGTGGSVLGALVYGPDRTNARGEKLNIENAMQAKNCEP